MRLPQRTPYLEPPAAELKAVHALLLARGTAERKAGLERVAVWLNRSACPYAVENTAALVEAQLAEERESASRSESMNSRLSLNMAIVRFVNSLVDSQQTGMYAAPVKTIAMRVGLPLWLVELRHAGTHDELPSLEALRSASKLALQWLDENFWLPSIRDSGRTFGADDKATAQDEIMDGLEAAEQPSRATGFESTLDIMRRRIAEAERHKKAAQGIAAGEKRQASAETGTVDALPPGWRKKDPSSWKATPLGLINGRIPELDL